MVRYSLIRLPEKTEIALFLIKEELKTRKLFHILQAAGMHESDFQPHLDSLILQSIGLDDDNDDLFEKYCDIMEKRSKKIDGDRKVLIKQVLKTYYEILNLKKDFAAHKS